MANPLDSFKQLPPWGKAAVGVGGAGAVYLVWRARKNAASASSTAAAAGGLATPDQAAGAGTGDGLPVAGPGTGGVPVTVGTTSGYGTNAAWSQAAQAGLAEVGFDPVSVATALGAYLAGQTLTASQAAIVFAATSEFGAPPVSPPPVVLGSSSGPAVSGNSAPTVSGGHVISVNNNDAEVGWTGTNAVKYAVRITGPGRINGRTNTIAGTTASYSGLDAGHTYTVYVTPIAANGQTGHTGQIVVKTTKGK